MTRDTFFAVSVTAVAAVLFTAAGLMHETRYPAGLPPGAGEGASGPAAKAESDSRAETALWPVFRGDFTLLGRAAGRIPESPSLKWSFRTGDIVKSSPVIGDARVYAGSFDSKLYAIDLDSGRETWAYPAADAFEAPPLVSGNSVFAGSLDGVLHCVESATGKPRWTFKTGAKIVGSANVLPPGQGAPGGIVVGSHDGALYCLDPDSGKEIWSLETGSYVNGAPAVAGGRIVFGGCDSMVRLLERDGSAVREVDTGSYVPASVAFDGRFAYAGIYEKELLCLDMSAGAVVWRYGDPENGSPFFSSPAVGPDRVLIGSQDMKLHCVGRADGKALWTFQARGAVDSSPVVGGGLVVFGSSDGRLCIVDAKDGKLVWSQDLGSAVSASPAVAGGWIVVASEDGLIWAFR